MTFWRCVDCEVPVRPGGRLCSYHQGYRALVAFLMVALGTLLLLADAYADPVLRCTAGDGGPGWCLDEPSIRTCDAAEAALPEVRLQLRAAEQRATVSAGDASRLSLSLDEQSALVADLQGALRAERRRLPAWTWTLVGAAGVLVLEAVALVLALTL